MLDALYDLTFYLWHAMTGDAMARGLGEFAVTAWRWRMFYRFKLAVCLLLGWELGGLPPVADHYLDGVIVATPRGGSGWSEWGTQYWGEYLAVGYGVTGHWWYCIYTDAT